MFYEDKINVPKERQQRRKKKRNRFKVKNKRDPLTPKQIREFLDNCRKLREKAMILTQFSSGLTMIDLLQLTLQKFNEG
ncbi:MAG: hypothetical protein QM396_01485 [Euryarchaeota archaeon]|uniref:hypothetical protein n=1 Tax=Methanobacterium sp. MZD130B TaxID=3394378 RepID=UPI0017651A6C|nr:hypothetical protein [Euryarchaeota archaeon]HHT18400.1 hypothetical protein [Methanobacterium sp.]